MYVKYNLHSTHYQRHIYTIIMYFKHILHITNVIFTHVYVKHTLHITNVIFTHMYVEHTLHVTNVIFTHVYVKHTLHITNVIFYTYICTHFNDAISQLVISISDIGGIVTCLCK